MASGNEVVLIESGASATEIESVPVAVRGVGAVSSVTSTVKVKVPTAPGVPEMIPAGESSSPGGGDPDMSIQE
jgi:hypothetical protein